MKLSKNFSLNEFTRSETGDRMGIDNRPGVNEQGSLINLSSLVLELVRGIYDAPIAITSGYRGEDLNRRIGGSPNSQHCKGEAADFLVAGYNSRQVCEAIQKSEIPFDQLILEYPSESQPDGAWVHISYSSRLRNQVMTAIREPGGTSYKMGLT